MNLDKLKEELKNFLEKTPYELYDVEIKSSKKETILTIYIDSLKGITLDDCVAATRLLDPFIDELDPIESEYLLEVSSPGAEKQLKSKEQVKNAEGRYIYLETYEQKLEGKLTNFDGEYLTLSIKNKDIKVNYIDVNLIRLAIKF